MKLDNSCDTARPILLLLESVGGGRVTRLAKQQLLNSITDYPENNCYLDVMGMKTDGLTS